MKRSVNKTVMTQFLIILMVLCFGAVASAQNLPKPGDRIDKSNADQYKDLFPEFWMDAFYTGFDGMIKPLSINIKDRTSNPMPQPFMDATALNKGKYSIDAEGYIAGGPEKDIVGYPFPDLDKSDPQFIQKFMWNFDYKYTLDDGRGRFFNFEKRKGSPVSVSYVENSLINFQSRLYDDPKPVYETAQGYRNANLLRNLAPPVQRNFLTLLIRYIDQRAADTTYLYLPSMRRVLRGEAGERSTPIMSSTNAPDDFMGFSGRIPEFAYELIGEQNAIGLADAQMDYDSLKDKDINPDYLPVDMEGWEVRDVYVIGITPKNPKYPQGRKVIWVDKETMTCLYSAAWDRAGKLWKVWQVPISKEENHSGPHTIPYATNLGIDLQLGYATNMVCTWTLNGQGITDADISIAAMRKLGR